jgi:hypothetical protein
MIKVVTSVSYPSKTIPGRSVSSYVSTPIADPTYSKIIKTLQDHCESLHYHLNACDPNNIKIDITIG